MQWQQTSSTSGISMHFACRLRRNAACPLAVPFIPQVHTTRDRAVWALGWVLVAVGLLQVVASIASQFI